MAAKQLTTWPLYSVKIYFDFFMEANEAHFGVDTDQSLLLLQAIWLLAAVNPGKTARSITSLRKRKPPQMSVKTFVFLLFCQGISNGPPAAVAAATGGEATPIRQPDPRGKQSDRRTPNRGRISESATPRGEQRRRDAALTPPPPFCLGGSVSCHRTLESRFHCDSSPPSAASAPACRPALPGSDAGAEPLQESG